MLLCRFARVYKSDNSLSVWGLDEEEIEKKETRAYFVFIGYLWRSWKCCMAVYMAKYT